MLSRVDKKTGAPCYPRFAKLPDAANAFPYKPDPDNLYELMPDVGTTIAASGLWIGTTDVSNAMWREFLRDSGRPEHAERSRMKKAFQDPRLLALFLSLDDAAELGNWLTHKLRTDFGLRVTIRPPTEGELKYAGLAGRTDLNIVMTQNGRWEAGQADYGQTWVSLPNRVDAAHIARIRFGTAEYMPLSGTGWYPTSTPFDPNGDSDIVGWFGASRFGDYAPRARAGFRYDRHRGLRDEYGAVRLVASEDSSQPT